MPKVKQKLNNIFTRIKGQFVYMVFFALSFVLMGKFIPELYYTYFDTTTYYSMELPLKTDKLNYHPGDTVKTTMKRTSQLDMDAFSVIELVLVDEVTKNEIWRERRDLSVNKGYEELTINYILPTNIDDGKYFYQGTVHYTIKGQQKYFNFYTDTFLVDEPDVKN